MAISDSLKKLLGGLVPTQTRMRLGGTRQQEPALAHTMDVNALAAVLREAESGHPAKLFALYRDIVAGHAHTQAEFNKRRLAVLGDEFRLMPQDADDPEQVSRAEQLQADLEDLPNWTGWVSHMLGSALWPVSVYERIWKPSRREGWRFELGQITPVPALHLDWPDGELRRRLVAGDGSFTGETEEFSERSFCLHRGHLLTEVPDWWGGPMRALVFWWLFSTMGRDWWARFLDRFGAPFLVGKYPSNDDAARYSLQDAFSAATKLLGIAISEDAKVEMLQASTANGDAFQLFHSTANKEISKLVVGQTLSAEGANLGLGGGQATAQAQVRDDIRSFDSAMLSAHFRVAIIRPLWTLNGWTSPLPKAVWGQVADDEDDVAATSALFAAVASIAQAGYQLSDAGLDALNQRTRYPLERAAISQAGQFGLSALAAQADPLTGLRHYPLTGPASRRHSRQEQARAACEDIAASASPQLARILRTRAAAVRQAILTSATPAEAEAKVAALSADLDPTTAAELIEATLSAASVNAILALDH